MLGCAALPAAASVSAAPATITVGELTLTLCRPHLAGYCGSIKQPIDPSGVTPGKFTIGFEYYPRLDIADPPLGTILPQEGGPGYSSTGTRDYYLEIFDALRDRRDILIVDKRGTGLSSPVDCPEMQTGSLALSAAAACARQLGDTAWFYGTDGTITIGPAYNPSVYSLNFAAGNYLITGGQIDLGGDLGYFKCRRAA